MGITGRRTPRLKLSADELDSVVGSWGSSPNVEAGPQQHSDGLPTLRGQTHGGAPASPTRHIPHVSEEFTRVATLQHRRLGYVTVITPCQSRSGVVDCDSLSFSRRESSRSSHAFDFGPLWPTAPSHRSTSQDEDEPTVTAFGIPIHR